MGSSFHSGRSTRGDFLCFALISRHSVIFLQSKREFRGSGCFLSWSGFYTPAIINAYFTEGRFLSAMDSGHEGQTLERVIEMISGKMLACNGCSIREVVMCECMNIIYYIWIGYLQYTRFRLLIDTIWIGGISLQKYGKRAARRCLLKM